ncbi:hypothetical protein E2320_002121, partial [Naja naja]
MEDEMEKKRDEAVGACKGTLKSSQDLSETQQVVEVVSDTMRQRPVSQEDFDGQGSFQEPVRDHPVTLTRELRTTILEWRAMGLLDLSDSRDWRYQNTMARSEPSRPLPLCHHGFTTSFSRCSPPFRTAFNGNPDKLAFYLNWAWAHIDKYGSGYPHDIAIIWAITDNLTREAAEGPTKWKSSQKRPQPLNASDAASKATKWLSAWPQPPSHKQWAQ